MRKRQQHHTQLIFSSVIPKKKVFFISFMNETIYIYAVFLPVKNRLSAIIGVHHKISNHVLIDETFFACARFFHLHTASMGSTAFRQFLFLLLEIIELLFASSRQSIIDWFPFFSPLSFSLSSFSRHSNRIKLTKRVFSRS